MYIFKFFFKVQVIALLTTAELRGFAALRAPKHKSIVEYTGQCVIDNSRVSFFEASQCPKFLVYSIYIFVECMYELCFIYIYIYIYIYIQY